MSFAILSHGQTVQAISPALYDLHHGDCLQVLKTLADNSVDSVVTDPPYELGFMGKGWDSTGIANNPALWAEVLRVLKPGGHLAAFSGSRTYHRIGCAIEDAGFQVRDQIMYIYGTGFPKSRSMRDIGRPELGTALKPAHEPICLARKPLSEKTVAANVLRWGTGAINVDGCRVEAPEGLTSGGNKTSSPLHMDRDANINRVSERAMGHALGRFPANLCHDGSQEVLDLFPESRGAVSNGRKGKPQATCYSDRGGQEQLPSYCDNGSAARYFYCAKASKADRAGSRHPTVKPIKLMQWLCRLITPPCGILLDPFAGSGTTGAAAILEGFRPILIEREDEYVIDIRRRLAA